MRNLLIAIALFGAFGCADKQTLAPRENELLAYTQKFERVGESTDKMMVVGTYITPVLGDRTRDEFVLSIYPQDIALVADTLRVNGKSASVKSIDEKEFSALSPVKIYWAEHYRVTTAPHEANDLVVAFRASDGTDVKLKFRKVSKSMYWTADNKE